MWVNRVTEVIGVIGVIWVYGGELGGRGEWSECGEWG